MENKLIRLLPLFGEEGLSLLTEKSVLIVGLGGVGGFFTEGLIRTGVLNIGLCDGDSVEFSNFNRQIIATDDALGKRKTEVMEQRIRSIRNDAVVKRYDFFVNEETIADLEIETYDLVVDCIDDVRAKILLIEQCKRIGVPILSCMGTGNKLDPNGFRIDDISKTSYCPLAKKVRTELRKKGIENVPVCFSKEVPFSHREAVIASPIFVVASASFVLLKEALRMLNVL